MIKIYYKEQGQKWNPSIRLKFEYDSEIVDAVQELDKQHFVNSTREWEIPADIDIINEFIESIENNFEYEIDDTTRKIINGEIEVDRPPDVLILVKEDIFTGKKEFRITFDYDKHIISMVKDLPTRKYITGGWNVPSSDYKFLLELIGELEYEGYVVDISDKSKELIEGEQKNSIGFLKSYNKAIVEFNFKTNPYLHQVQGFNTAVSRANLLIGDEQGLGKTKQAIDAAVYRCEQGQIRKCLIICGVNSLKYNWHEEIGVHSYEHSHLIKASTPKTRLKQLEKWILSDDLFGIVNIEMLRNKQIHEFVKGKINSNEIEMIIIDEVHKIKNYKTKQTKAILELKPTYRLALTGTPISKCSLDAYNVLNWLRIEERPFSIFRSRYAVINSWGGFEENKNKEELNKILDKVMIRRKKDEVLDLPEKIYSTEYIEFGKDAWELYNDKINEIKSQYFTGQANALELITALRKITAGIEGDDKSKVDRAVEIINENIIENDKKAIVFSNWVKEIELLETKLREENIKYVKITGQTSLQDRHTYIKEFQDGNASVIIGTIGAMGTGLTLNQAECVIFMDKAWNPSENEQAEDRAHRIGTKNIVNIISLVVKDSIDEYIEQLLLKKKADIDVMVDGKDVEKTDANELLLKVLKISKKDLKELRRKFNQDKNN